MNEVVPEAATGAATGAAAAAALLHEHGHLRIKHCRHGLFIYNMLDRYVGRSLDRYGEFSESEIALFDQLLRPGCVAFDVGANIGAHTIWLAGKVGEKGRVVAFEPQRVIHQMLCANLALNGCENVYALWAAAGQTGGSARVPRLDYRAENNFGGIPLAPANSTDETSEGVPAMRIDDVQVPRCDLIKIDVEGMEQEVVAGAERIIRKYRPMLYVENDRRDRAEALVGALRSLDYRLFWHLPRLYNPENFFGEGENVFGRIVSVNMLCVPSERPIQTALREVQDADWRKG
ncbi:MAG: FkbM family methyltransferase [Rhodospirillaceae bacterium]|nr:FkbM family methyltransferase [Rhodospirillaceae bacterium]